MSDLTAYGVIFDLDGTLVDTAPDLVRALNRVLESEGLETVPLPEVRSLVGHGARALIERGFARAGATLDADALARLTAHFIEAYSADIAAASVPFEGAEQALGELRDRGAPLVICTNKPTKLARQLLDALKLSHWFVGIIGPEDAPARKPDPAHFRAAAAAAARAPEACLMVGDSAPDVQSARAAGAAGVLVTRFGYASAPPETLGADAVFDAFAELPDLAARLLRTRPPTG